MSLLDEAIRLQNKPGSPCRLGALRAERPDLFAEIMEALDANVQAAAVSRALKKVHGLDIRPDALTRHRRNECGRCRS